MNFFSLSHTKLLYHRFLRSLASSYPHSMHYYTSCVLISRYCFVSDVHYASISLHYSYSCVIVLSSRGSFASSTSSSHCQHSQCILVNFSSDSPPGLASCIELWRSRTFPTVTCDFLPFSSKIPSISWYFAKSTYKPHNNLLQYICTAYI